MGLEFYQNYLNNLAQTPSQFYKDQLQNTIDYFFTDNTQVRTIKEQSYPFSDVYTEYQVYVDTVSDLTVAYQKTISDFIQITFQDCSHALNVRGQKYLYAPDGTDYQTYLCYDEINPLTHIADLKAVRCNNYINWINSSGEIVQEPIYLGYELFSTNNQISKEGIVPQRRLVVYMQGNTNTKQIELNQRFMLNHGTVFKVTEFNSFVMDDTTNGDVTMLCMYIEWASLLPTDNTALNLCNYNPDDYSLTLNPTVIQNVTGNKGTIIPTILYKGSVITADLNWVSSNTSVCTIDSSGNYELLGTDGQTAIITCSIVNTTVNQTINVTVSNFATTSDIITVTPVINEIFEGESQIFTCSTTSNEGLYPYYIVYPYSKTYPSGNWNYNETVNCVPNWTNNNYYTLTQVSGGWKLNCIAQTDNILTLSFESGTLKPIVMNISLNSLL